MEAAGGESNEEPGSLVEYEREYDVKFYAADAPLPIFLDDDQVTLPVELAGSVRPEELKEDALVEELPKDDYAEEQALQDAPPEHGALEAVNNVNVYISQSTESLQGYEGDLETSVELGISENVELSDEGILEKLTSDAKGGRAVVTYKRDGLTDSSKIVAGTKLTRSVSTSSLDKKLQIKAKHVVISDKKHDIIYSPPIARTESQIMSEFNEQERQFQSEVLNVSQSERPPRHTSVRRRRAATQHEFPLMEKVVDNTPYQSPLRSPAAGGASVGVAHLDNLLCLLEQMAAIRTENRSLRERCIYLHDTRQLLRLHNRALVKNQSHLLDTPPSRRSRSHNRTRSKKSAHISYSDSSDVECGGSIDSSPGLRKIPPKLSQRCQSAGSIDVCSSNPALDLDTDLSLRKEQVSKYKIAEKSKKNTGLEGVFSKVKKVFQGKPEPGQLKTCGSTPQVSAQQLVNANSRAQAQYDSRPSEYAQVSPQPSTAAPSNLGTDSGLDLDPHGGSLSSSILGEEFSQTSHLINQPPDEHMNIQGRHCSTTYRQKSSSHFTTDATNYEQLSPESAQNAFFPAHSRSPSNSSKMTTSSSPLPPPHPNSSIPVLPNSGHDKAYNVPSDEPHHYGPRKPARAQRSTTWGKVKNIIHTRKDSLKLRGARSHSAGDMLPNRGSVSDGEYVTHVDDEGPDLWDNEECTVTLQDRKPSASPTRKVSVYIPNKTFESFDIESPSVDSPHSSQYRDSMSHSFPSPNISAMMGDVGEDFARKLQEWDDKMKRGALSKDKKDEFGNDASKEKFTEDFIRKMEEWERMKGPAANKCASTGSGYFSSSQDVSTPKEEQVEQLSESFSKTVKEWELIKTQRLKDCDTPTRDGSAPPKAAERRSRFDRARLDRSKSRDRGRDQSRNKVDRQREKELQKIEKKEKMIEKEREKLGKLKQKLEGIDSPVVSTSGMTPDFAKKLQEWETMKNTRPGESGEAASPQESEPAACGTPRGTPPQRAQTMRHSRPLSKAAAKAKRERCKSVGVQEAHITESDSDSEASPEAVKQLRSSSMPSICPLVASEGKDESTSIDFNLMQDYQPSADEATAVADQPGELSEQESALAGLQGEVVRLQGCLQTKDAVHAAQIACYKEEVWSARRHNTAAAQAERLVAWLRDLHHQVVCLDEARHQAEADNRHLQALLAEEVSAKMSQHMDVIEQIGVADVDSGDSFEQLGNFLYKVHSQLCRLRHGLREREEVVRHLQHQLCKANVNNRLMAAAALHRAMHRDSAERRRSHLRKSYSWGGADAHERGVQVHISCRSDAADPQPGPYLIADEFIPTMSECGHMESPEEISLTWLEKIMLGRHLFKDPPLVELRETQTELMLEDTPVQTDPPPPSHPRYIQTDAPPPLLDYSSQTDIPDPGVSTLTQTDDSDVGCQMEVGPVGADLHLTSNITTQTDDGITTIEMMDFGMQTSPAFWQPKSDDKATDTDENSSTSRTESPAQEPVTFLYQTDRPGMWFPRIPIPPHPPLSTTDTDDDSDTSVATSVPGIRSSSYGLAHLDQALYDKEDASSETLSQRESEPSMLSSTCHSSIMSIPDDTFNADNVNIGDALTTSLSNNEDFQQCVTRLTLCSPFSESDDSSRCGTSVDHPHFRTRNGQMMNSSELSPENNFQMASLPATTEDKQALVDRWVTPNMHREIPLGISSSNFPMTYSCSVTRTDSSLSNEDNSTHITRDREENLENHDDDIAMRVEKDIDELSVSTVIQQDVVCQMEVGPCRADLHLTSHTNERQQTQVAPPLSISSCLDTQSMDQSYDSTITYDGSKSGSQSSIILPPPETKQPQELMINAEQALADTTTHVERDKLIDAPLVLTVNASILGGTLKAPQPFKNEQIKEKGKHRVNNIKRTKSINTIRRELNMYSMIQNGEENKTAHNSIPKISEIIPLRTTVHRQIGIASVEIVQSSHLSNLHSAVEAAADEFSECNNRIHSEFCQESKGITCTGPLCRTRVDSVGRQSSGCSTSVLDSETEVFSDNSSDQLPISPLNRRSHKMCKHKPAIGESESDTVKRRVHYKTTSSESTIEDKTDQVSESPESDITSVELPSTTSETTGTQAATHINDSNDDIDIAHAHSDDAGDNKIYLSVNDRYKANFPPENVLCAQPTMHSPRDAGCQMEVSPYRADLHLTSHITAPLRPLATPTLHLKSASELVSDNINYALNHSALRKLKMELKSSAVMNKENSSDEDKRLSPLPHCSSMDTNTRVHNPPLKDRTNEKEEDDTNEHSIIPETPYRLESRFTKSHITPIEKVKEELSERASLECNKRASSIEKKISELPLGGTVSRRAEIYERKSQNKESCGCSISSSIQSLVDGFTPRNRSRSDSRSTVSMDLKSRSSSTGSYKSPCESPCVREPRSRLLSCVARQDKEVSKPWKECESPGAVSTLCRQTVSINIEKDSVTDSEKQSTPEKRKGFWWLHNPARLFKTPR